VPRVEATYRLPSMILVQQEPLPPLTAQIGHLTFTVFGPLAEPQSGLRGPWSGEWDRDRRYCDTLRVAVAVPEPKAADRTAVSQEVWPQLRDPLRQLLRRLLEAIAFVTRQEWIGIMPSPMTWYELPVRWEYFEDGGEAPATSGMTTEPVIDLRRRLTAEKWLEVGRWLLSEDELPLPRLLLLESVGLRRAGNVRSAVLTCAMACEVAAKSFARDIGSRRDPLYTYVVDKDRELSIFDYLNDVLEILTGKKTKDVIRAPFMGREVNFSHLEQLFQARNKVAHEGRAYFRRGRSSVVVDDSRLTEFQFAASGFLSYLEGERRRLLDGGADQGAGGSA
jgi:hypothetical protein